MSLFILGAVLFAALLHATWNALIKVSGDRLVVMAVTTATSSILLMPLLLTLAVLLWWLLGRARRKG